MKAFAFILSLYFFLGSLFPGNDFSQLTRLHEWGDHFHEHKALAKQEGAPIDFFSFLLEHLLSPDSHQHESGNDHQELPYFSPGVSLTFLPAFIQLPESDIKDSIPPLIAKAGHFRARLFSTLIFQPPA